MELIESAKKQATDSVEIFLRNFSKVPVDRWNWSPAPTAKSALRIAAHTATYLHRFAAMIRDRQVPAVADLQAWLDQQEASERAVTSPAEVETIARSGLAEVLSALETLRAEDVDSELDSGQGWTMSMRFLVMLPSWHTAVHTGQIDYLQTCWGDQEIYVG
jgi:hypothetical protein